jgi:hypothetical protein
MSPPRLWPPTDYSTNYRPVLSSERAAPRRRAKQFYGKRKGKAKSGHGPNTQTYWLTDWLTVSRKVTSTSVYAFVEFHTPVTCKGVWSIDRVISREIISWPWDKQGNYFVLWVIKNITLEYRQTVRRRFLMDYISYPYTLCVTVMLLNDRAQVMKC